MNCHRRQFLTGSVAALLAARAPAAPRSNARAITSGPDCHFFGYYDKCPWDATGRYLLAMRIGFCNRQPRPGEALTLGRIDLKDANRFLPFAKTTAWCWQQGTMLQWLGSAPARVVVYNAVQDRNYVGVVHDLASDKQRLLPRPLYAVSSDGKQAVSLPFDRLHRLRPGYGYCALPEKSPDDSAPKNDGVWHLDVESGQTRLLVPLAQLAKHKPDATFSGAQHWVNHLQFNPSGTRILFLHRWRVFEKSWKTRLYTCKPDGSELTLVLDTGMVSHFDWRDDATILAWAQLPSGAKRFALFDAAGVKKPQVIGNDVLTEDGHCSYSPDRRWILNDTYPDAKRLQHLMLFRVKDGRRIDLQAFYLTRDLSGPVRCDLHPRWNREGTQVCLDSAHIGDKRQLYVLDVSEIVKG